MQEAKNERRHRSPLFALACVIVAVLAFLSSNSCDQGGEPSETNQTSSAKQATYAELPTNTPTTEPTGKPDVTPAANNGSGVGPDDNQPVNPVVVDPQPTVAKPVNFGKALPAPAAGWFELPHAKGEFFTLTKPSTSRFVLASLGRESVFDPLWNRRDPQSWLANELAGATITKNETLWGRQTFERYVDIHKAKDADWDVAHSPFIVSNAAYWMRFRRVIKGGKRKHFTRVDAVGARAQWLELKNLADSPRPRPGTIPGGNGVLFRIFPKGDERSRLELWLLGANKALATFGNEKTDFFSRPAWISENQFVVVRATQLVGNNKSAYDGELLLVTLGAGNELAAKVIDKGVYPVETMIDTLLYNTASKTLSVIKNAGDKREITLFDMTDPVKPKGKPVKGVALPCAVVRNGADFIAISNNQVMNLKADGKLEETEIYLPQVPRGAHDIGTGVSLLIGEGQANVKQPAGKGFDYSLVHWDEKLIPLQFTDRADCRAQLPSASWITKNCTWSRLVQEAIEAERLDSTTLIY